MSTRTEEPLVEAQRTNLAQMPPLEVTREGIPAHEHVPTAPLPTSREHRARTYAWALVGVLALLLVVAGSWLVMRAPSSTTLHMGLSTQAWQDYRAGERAPLAATLAAQMGLGAQAWRDYRAGEQAAYLGPTAGHMGLSTQAWQDYRAGERAPFAATQAALMGLSTQAWQDYRAGEQAA